MRYVNALAGSYRAIIDFSASSIPTHFFWVTSINIGNVCPLMNACCMQCLLLDKAEIEAEIDNNFDYNEIA